MSFSCRLSSRSLIRVSGTMAHEFLQGLFTNDLRLLQPGGSMWGCFLYHTGRVMCDAYLYQSSRVYNGQAAILVDVHRNVADTLHDHLLEMRMRKKVQIHDVSNELTVLATALSEKSTQREEKDALVASSPSSNDTLTSGSGSGSSSSSGSNTSAAAQKKTSAISPEAEVFVDPRSFALPSPLHKTILPAAWVPSTTDPTALYDAFLYGAGIGEGPDVFRPSKTLPFEANTDFLRGVSFHKGCYLGQELTHRTHVMLVTRKRTVPLRLPHTRNGMGGTRLVEKGEVLLVDGQKVGEVLAVSGDVGLGLLRLRYVDSATRKVPGLVLHDALPVTVSIPSWWEEKEVRKVLSGP
ncbi:transferase C1orf69 like protein, mitochondrial [Trypanosoma grayi]|uniref:transferase C1orf69 like protein, mitochondrial n=1 Tax=Trypanosoma grayi TaxID=71804 RepID=UPI0004F48B61|nr:transferase C1orf69 like protein, mitochondrial [Trypanosoma grayi]KEG09480.1 transferase C1orf69 like protein, mitochondrial [Trypanosoma grayi]